MKNSRTRLIEYVGLFNRVDEIRLEILQSLTLRLEGEGKEDPFYTDVLLEDLEMAEGIADSVVNAMMENGELSGN